ncbi:hypothetical protein EJB05_05101, partial [Eragrostis curvula]
LRGLGRTLKSNLFNTQRSHQSPGRLLLPLPRPLPINPASFRHARECQAEAHSQEPDMSRPLLAVRARVSLLLLCCCSLAAWSPWPLVPAARALPLCTDGRAPVAPKRTLGFCSSDGGSTCCDAAADAALQKQFEAMKVSDAACAAVIKSVLCAKCNPFSAQLFNTSSKMVPLLCYNTSSASSTQSNATEEYCKRVWKTCKSVTILNSPFQSPLQEKAKLPSSSSKLTNVWKTEKDFCASFGGSSDDHSICFSGNAVSFNAPEPLPSPKGLCLERLFNGPYLNMAPHPDGSNRVFLSSQAGKIWLATVPAQGSGGTLEFDEAKPFLDLTDKVYHDPKSGLMGIAFHPKFATNGRLFVSYYCDRTQSLSCAGRCSCNYDAGCDPSKLSPDDEDAQPCQYQVVVSEYSAKVSSSNVSKATSADPSEVRRIFTMGMPYTGRYGGQILFGPTDGYLYLMIGDGGSKGDPFNFSQNKKSLLGKIVRLDIDGKQGQSQINNRSLWGNYYIPKDNPFADDSDLEPEIWALGLGHPWRCNFDSERPSYFYCGDAGQDVYEEVDLITKGGNYGWRVYEGPYIYHPHRSPGGNTSLDSIDAISPIMGYNHSEVNKKIGSASIIGGYVYRGSADPCLYGRYLYTDLYSSSMWTGTETPEGSGNYTTSVIPLSCTKNSPIACESTAGSPEPTLGYMFTFGEDNNKDIFLLASKGIYRVVRPSLCGFTCPAEKLVSNNGTTPTGPSSLSPATRPGKSVAVALALAVCALFFS